MLHIFLSYDYAMKNIRKTVVKVKFFRSTNEKTQRKCGIVGESTDILHILIYKQNYIPDHRIEENAWCIIEYKNLTICLYKTFIVLIVCSSFRFKWNY